MYEQKQIKDAIRINGEEISELKVMQSGAGYYLGRSCDGCPYSRQSEYFATQEGAERALAIYPIGRRITAENSPIYIVEHIREVALEDYER